MLRFWGGGGGVSRMENMQSYWQFGDELRGQSKVCEDLKWYATALRLAEQTRLKGESHFFCRLGCTFPFKRKRCRGNKPTSSRRIHNNFWTCSVSKLCYSGMLVTTEFESFYLISGYVLNSVIGLKRLIEFRPSLEMVA
ncbi:hypothetical protein L1987_06688 [Smallanthus sonchifolius]|uniref:Uncharacterized protein n=1 Tax=Smallanthus sonchifolius TaxID=185202 RepID=A0ACB9JYT0_9ASTR|nr:hypothetical protein L1987_06688 [Smallanthus sonchifolius]